MEFCASGLSERINAASRAYLVYSFFNVGRIERPVSISFYCPHDINGNIGGVVEVLAAPGEVQRKGRDPRHVLQLNDVITGSLSLGNWQFTSERAFGMC